MKNRAISLALTLIALFVLAVLVWRATAPREPMYKDKPLSYWLDLAYGDADWTEQAAFDAHEAVRTTGTNAIPTLLLDLRAKDPPFADRVSYFLVRSGLERPSSNDAYSKNNEAAMGFEILGDRAKDSVPALVEIYKRHISPGSEVAAIRCLGAIGPDARAAIPILLTALTNQANFGQNYVAADALGAIHSEPDLVVPALVDCLTNCDNSLRLSSEKALQKFGPVATAAVPALMALVNDATQTKFVRQQAVETIKIISPWRAAKIPPETLKGLE